MNSNSGLQSRLLIYAAVLATVAVYWAGLRGPFLLDDMQNLAPLQRWLDGEAGAIEVILGNRSGILGRPVSMATLWFSAATGGLHPFPFKFGNLLIHLACGVVGWQLLHRLLERDPHLAAKATVVAAVLAGLWLLHPIHVSTVLYAVQRMAQLSALFALACVWVYVLARQQLVEGNVRRASLKLFALFPVLLLVGLFSKESAAVAPVLCLVVELAYFQRQEQAQGQDSVRRVLSWFYGLFLLLPMLLAVALLLISPERLLGGYAIRDFTLVERLLSQSRALMEYLGLILWPRGGLMGVYVDDFAHSTGLLSPITTLLSILVLLGLSGFAIAIRKQAPSVFAGWFFFLVAHGVESTFLPLELYFEHRNYLPAFGILLALAGLLAWAADRSGLRGRPWFGKASWGLAAVAAIGLSVVTWQQVHVWRSEHTLAMQALQHRPESLRAALAKLTMDVNEKRWDEARQAIDTLVSSSNPRHRLIGNVYRVAIDCLSGDGVDPVLMTRAIESGVTYLTTADAQAFAQLANVMEAGYCGPELSTVGIADTIEALMEATPGQSDLQQPKWLLRMTAAELYHRAGRWDDGRRQLELAWYPGTSDTAIGGLLVRSYMRGGDKAAAQRTLSQLRHLVPRYELAAQEQLEYLQQEINEMAD